MGAQVEPKILTERMNAQMSRNLLLAEKKWKPFCSGLDWTTSEGRQKVALNARLLENIRKWMIQEETRGISIGDFQKYAFPLVRAIFPELVANSIVSVQPMLGPTSLVFYLDFVYASNKGKITAGQKAFDSVALGPNYANYSSETIENENIGTGDGVSTAYTPTLSYTPIKGTTLTITTLDASGNVLTVTDDGNGALTGSLTGATKTINYSNGGLVFTLSAAPGSGQPILATYDYDMEAQPNIPEIDLILSSSPVIARPRKLRSKWSLEAAFNLRSLHGLDTETELVAALGAEIRFEIDQEIINDIFNIVPNFNLIPAWSKTKVFNQDDTYTTASGATDSVSYTEHKLSLVDAFVVGGNKIYASTGRATATWIVAGINVCNVVETLPGFVPTPGLPNGLTKGIYKVGALLGRYDVFKDPFPFGTTVSTNQYIMGYKGTSFLEAGYVYAPYIPMYSTPTIVLDDFVARKGLATQYGKKVVNPRFYAKGQIVS